MSWRRKVACDSEQGLIVLGMAPLSMGGCSGLDGSVLELVPCLLCGSNEAKQLRALRDRYYGGQETFYIEKCIECGLLYLNPRPKPGMVDRYYPDDYVSYSLPVELRVQADFSGLGGWLRSQMFVPGSWLGAALRTWFVSWKTNWRWFYAAHPELRGGKIVDVGCGSGQSLMLFKKFGWETYGVDISDRAVELARSSGLRVFKAELGDARFPTNYFDLVWMSHVLEHLHDPVKALAEVHRILKPSGILFVEIPVIDSLLPSIFGRYYYGWECPRHLYHFSKNTLSRLSLDCGFQSKILGRASNAWILSMSFSYLLEGLFPRRAKAIRTHLSICRGKPWLPLLSCMSIATRLAGLGEILFVELRKKA